MRKIAGAFLVAGSMLAASAACAQRSGAPASIRRAKGPAVRVQVLDGSSARPLANADVQVTSDNGIRCIQAPCPTNGAGWRGRSDAAGWVAIPTNTLQASTSIEVPGYEAGDLVENASPAPGGWVVDLLPRDTAALPPHPIKLLDARTGRPLARVPVRLEYQAQGRSAQSNLTTNALGYIFVPFEVVTESPEQTFVEVKGYRRTRLDFAGVRRLTRLDRR